MNVFQQTFRFVQDILRELERHNDWNACELKRIFEQGQAILGQAQANGEQIQLLDLRMDVLAQQVATLLAEAIPSVVSFEVTVDPPINQ